VKFVFKMHLRREKYSLLRLAVFLQSQQAEPNRLLNIFETEMFPSVFGHGTVRVTMLDRQKSYFVN
jgi:hypothetical protein